MSLLLGDTAPNFQIDSQKGKIDFHEFIGNSWCFFFSHPADFTPVCTTEMGRTAQLASEFEKTMLETQIGIISEVFQTEFGFHFLEVLDKRSYEKTDELIKDRAYSMLYARKFDEELENTLRTMRAEAFVEFKELD